MHQLTFDDITISRHRGAATSIAANKTVQPSKAFARGAIIQLMALREMKGDAGTTSYDIEKAFGWPKNVFSGRLTELKKAGLIVPVKGEIRNGCQALEIASKQ
jgi:DNA-binding IscR family transcriptional regulator